MASLAEDSGTATKNYDKVHKTLLKRTLAQINFPLRLQHKDSSAVISSSCLTNPSVDPDCEETVHAVSVDAWWRFELGMGAGLFND